ncbi:MAG: hypothetical protein OWT28_09060 [Firmicutes bacterium]|nr:hypothetical protein [Bacillota bacterium]
MTYYLLHSGQGSAERLARRVPRLVAIRDIRPVGPDDIVIRYGNVREADAGWWTLNRRQAVRYAENPGQLHKILRRSGVRSPRQKGEGNLSQAAKLQLVRHYRIPVFSLKALACFRTEGKTVWLHQRVNQVQDAFSEVAVDTDEQARKVCLLAVRAVHALGLECGLVSIGIGPQGAAWVLDVAPSPVLRGRMLEVYAAGVVDYMEKQDRQRAGADPNMQLGTDLEFMLKTRQDKMMLASKFFPKQGTVGCDARTFGGDRNKRPLAELRPAPGRTPEELCRNIENGLQEAAKLARHEYPKWVAGSAPFERFPIGGHIHFSGLPYTGRLVSLLDVYVGLPLMLIEDPVSASRRRPRYGFLGDIRHKAWGFEYRTPSSFLVDPDLAQGALALAYVVAMHHAQLPYLPLHTAENSKAFYRTDRDQLLSMALEVREQLSRTASYARYREVIDPIFDMIVHDEVWDESVDVRTAWGIPLEMPREKKRERRTRAS